ncbi:cupin domain-containing protein [Sulfuriflexus mobilis]|uniref:cupin domain-containing protein n=1 Tax=Sulfuriflexus mobilis TaxID=1811807 RepID=UPI000F832FC3|nr:cupin domain-containing protein [Sulfuriflexus mobilis]
MNSKHHTSRRETPAYTTKDGSQIRELMHPSSHTSQNQSLAEAVVPAGTSTRLHRHQNSEELYHITVGSGMMRLADKEFEVKAGDTVCIAPGTAHCICNTGDGDLVILCCCSPAYRHEDTELL